MKNFNLDEFRCPCCLQCLMVDEFLNLLDRARDGAGIPFKILSGYRCAAHNITVGGKPTSAHLLGRAADIQVIGGRDREIILRAMVLVGFRRIGIAQNFVHVDLDTQKDPSVWLY